MLSIGAAIAPAATVPEVLMKSRLLIVLTVLPLLFVESVESCDIDNHDNQSNNTCSARNRDAHPPDRKKKPAERTKRSAGFFAGASRDAFVGRDADSKVLTDFHVWGRVVKRPRHHAQTLQIPRRRWRCAGCGSAQRTGLRGNCLVPKGVGALGSARRIR
jgi:hypothetical protein